MKYRRLADSTDERSVATRLRRKRFSLLLDLLRPLPRPVRILDVGGRQKYWEMMGLDWSRQSDLHITLLNPEAQSVSLPNFTAVAGDGRSLAQFRDGQFDVVFSNSTIEHVGALEDQRLMANEVRRVGKSYYVQTPNRYFPIEPHFVFPFFQFLPVGLKIWLLRHFSLGWFSRIPDREMARREATGIRLMTRAEVRQLFPEAIIFEERFCGMTKSFVAYATLQLPEESKRENEDLVRC